MGDGEPEKANKTKETKNSLAFFRAFQQSDLEALALDAGRTIFTGKQKDTVGA
jgi:hypothetical protein